MNTIDRLFVLLISVVGLVGLTVLILIGTPYRTSGQWGMEEHRERRVLPADGSPIQVPMVVDKVSALEILVLTQSPTLRLRVRTPQEQWWAADALPAKGVMFSQGDWSGLSVDARPLAGVDPFHRVEPFQRVDGTIAPGTQAYGVIIGDPDPGTYTLEVVGAAGSDGERTIVLIVGLEGGVDFSARVLPPESVFWRQSGVWFHTGGAYLASSLIPDAVITTEVVGPDGRVQTVQLQNESEYSFDGMYFGALAESMLTVPGEYAVRFGATGQTRAGHAFRRSVVTSFSVSRWIIVRRPIVRWAIGAVVVVAAVGIVIAARWRRTPRAAA